MNNLGNKEIMARNIQHYLDINGKDRNDLCRDLGFKYTTVSNWLQGVKYPRIDKIEIMARYFGVSKADLVEDHPTSAPDQELSDHDKNMVAAYNAAPASTQRIVDVALEPFMPKEHSDDGKADFEEEGA